MPHLKGKGVWQSCHVFMLIYVYYGHMVKGSGVVWVFSGQGSEWTKMAKPCERIQRYCSVLSGKVDAINLPYTRRDRLVIYVSCYLDCLEHALSHMVAAVGYCS